MCIPFANRTADVDLPAAPGQGKVTVKHVIDSFQGQFPDNFVNIFEAFVLLSPRKIRVTFRSPRALEEAQNLGLAFRNQPVVLHPCRTAKWVNMTQLSYGVPDKALQDALTPFGRVLQVKMDIYKNVYVVLAPAWQDLVHQVLGSVVEQVHKEAATFAAVVGAGQHISNEGLQDTAGPKITDEGHATIDVASATNHLDGHISQSLLVNGEGETSASLLNGVGSVQQRSVSDGSQGLKSDGAD